MATHTARYECRRMAHKASSVLAFTVPLSVYLLTLAPGLTWAHHGADGGDLVTAAYTLGIPHPPGYPTYTPLAWLFTRLPFGDVAWRVNLLSAIGTAGAAALIHWTVTNWVRERLGVSASVAGLGAALSYAFSALVWSQALIAEVYGLTGLWTALVLWLSRSAADKQDGSWLAAKQGRKGSGRVPGIAFAIGLVWSLGLGVHLSLICLAPILVWEFRQSGRTSRRWMVVGFLCGLLAWLYLPLRAGRGGVTWGQPNTLDGFWWLVSGALYRQYVFALPTSALSVRLAAWAQTWIGGLGFSGTGFAMLGVARLAGHRLSWLAAMGLSFVALNLYALGYNTVDSVVYLVPAFVIASIWLGVGLAVLCIRIYDLGARWIGGSKRHWLTPMLLVVAVTTPAWTLARNGAALDLSDDRTAEDFGQTVMSDAPPRAILLTTTDRQTFALWYHQQVKGLRPDVAVIDEGLWGFEWYRAGLQQAHPGLWRNQRDARAPAVLTNERPQCRIRRESHMGWLDCPSSKTGHGP